MKIVYPIVWVSLALLSLAAGSAKILQMPQEVQFFKDAGLGMVVLSGLGWAQVMGAILLLIKKTRQWGALITGLGFLISSLIIFKTGQIGFGVFSLIPVLFVALIFLKAKRDTAV